MGKEITNRSFYFDLFRRSFIKSGEIYQRTRGKDGKSLWRIQYELITKEVGTDALADIPDEELDSLAADLVPDFLKRKVEGKLHDNVQEGEEKARIKNQLSLLRQGAQYYRTRIK